MGTRFPPACLSNASARVLFQRHLLVNIGDCSAACTKSALTVFEETIEKTDSKGKLCCSPSEITTPSSVAAAWSSKSKETQNRFLKAKPSALLIRPPSGECMTSCIPPASSKNRSTTIRSPVGTAPRIATVSNMYSVICLAPHSVRPISFISQCCAAALSGRCPATASLKLDTALESS